MKYQYWVSAAGLLLFLYAGAVICGWLLHIPFWHAISPTGTLMVFQAAFCFALAGIGLAAPQIYPGRAAMIRLVLGSAVAVIGALVLVESFFSVDIGIDLAQIHFWYQDKADYPGRMAPNAALGFMLAGIAFIQIALAKKYNPHFVAIPASVITLGLMGLLGYSLIFDLAYGWFNGVRRMALPAAIGMIILGTFLLLDHEKLPGKIRGRADADRIRSSDEARVYAFFGVAITILVTMSFVSYGSIKALIERAAWVEHTVEVRAEFEKILALGSQAHSARVTYFATGKRDSLKQTRTEGTEMLERLKNLRSQIEDNPQQQQRLNEIQTLIESSLSLMTSFDATQVKHISENSAEYVALQTKLSKNRQQIYHHAELFKAEETRLLAQRQEESRAGAKSVTKTIAFGNLLGLAIMLYAAWLLKRQNTARDRLELSLLQSEERARLVIENVTDYAIIPLDPDGNIQGWNRGAERIKGYRAEEIIGQHFSRFYLPEDIAHGEPDRILSIAATEGHCEREGWRVRKDGTKFWANVVFNPLRDRSGELIGFIKVTRDLSERKKNEEELLRNNIFLDSLLENMPIAVFVKDASDLRYVRVNKTSEAMLGLARSYTLGKSDYDIHPQEDADFFNAADRDVLARNEILDIPQESVHTRDKGIRILHTMKIPIRDENGQMKYLLGLSEDITERKNAEEKLRRNNAFLDSLIEHIPSIVTVKHADSLQVVRINRAGEKLLGMARNEVLGKTYHDLLDKEKAETIAGQDRLALAGKGARESLDNYFDPKNKVLHILRTWKIPILDVDGHPLYLLSISDDITEIKEAEEQLRAQNKFLDSILENIPLMVFVKDAQNLRFLRFNKAGETMLGFARSDLIGKNDYDFFPQQEADFFTAKDREVLAGSEILDIAEESIHTSHNGIRTLHTMKIPIHDENGQPQYLLGISEDITVRKQTGQQVITLNNDLKSRAIELEATNKELESFTYSVSHDLRAPLRAINGYALMLGEDYKDKVDDEGRRYIDQIHHYSKQMGELIDDLLRLSRLGRQALNKIDVDMAELLRSALQPELDAREGSLPKIDIGNLPRANVDPLLLRQVWGNLISNALKYSSKTPEAAIDISGMESGDELVYCVKDNGAGFDMTYYEKLFSVFQRLHRADEFPGTGVGLAIVHRVITRHGGRVWAEGKPGEGAAFYFALPTHDVFGENTGVDRGRLS